MPDQIPQQNQPAPEPIPEPITPASTLPPEPVRPKSKKYIIWAAVSVAILLLLGGGAFGYWKITLNSRSETICFPLKKMALTKSQLRQEKISSIADIIELKTNIYESNIKNRT